MSLDLSSLENSLGRLEEALDIYDSEISRSDPRLQKHLRAAAIQAFEFTYGLSYKMLKRYLELASANPAEIDSLSFNNLIREAFKQTLVQSDLSVWQGYRRNRGITSHTYDEEKAQEVFESLPDFLREAQYLLSQLQKKNQSLD